MAPRKKKEEEAATPTKTKSGRVSKTPKDFVQNCVMIFAKVAKSKDKKKKQKQKQEQNKRDTGKRRNPWGSSEMNLLTFGNEFLVVK